MIPSTQRPTPSIKFFLLYLLFIIQAQSEAQSRDITRFYGLQTATKTCKEYCKSLSLSCAASPQSDLKKEAPCNSVPSGGNTALCPCLWPPTMSPSFSPTPSPTDGPVASPTSSPSDQPSLAPSASPSLIPSSLPTSCPSSRPSSSPSASPIASTALPSVSPSTSPSSAPSPLSTMAPSLSSSKSPMEVSSAARSTTPSISTATAMPSLPLAASTISFLPSGQPSRGPSTFQPSQLPSLNPIYDAEMKKFCRFDVPVCRSSSSECSTVLFFSVRQSLDNVNAMNINNSSALILCAVGAVTNLSLASMSIESIVKTNSSTRKKISLSADSYIVTYTVQLVPNAYNYSSPSAAYNSIASSIHSNVQDGQFTKILNTLSSETTHAFDAPASSNYVNVNSVLASNVPTVVPTGDSGSSLDTRTRGANSDASFVLIIAIVVTVVGLCLLMGACYIYVRGFHFKSQARKLSALQQTSLRGMGAISPQGEIIPDYGDIVDPEIIQAPDEGDNRRASMPGILDGSAPSDTGRIGSLRFPHRFIL